jgi:hypothetical protein
MSRSDNIPRMGGEPTARGLLIVDHSTKLPHPTGRPKVGDVVLT